MVTQSISSRVFFPRRTCSKAKIEPSPRAATIHPATTAFNTAAPILTPGMAFNAVRAVFAARLTVPAPIIVVKNSFARSSFLIPYTWATAVIIAISVGTKIAVSGTGTGTAPTTTPPVVAAATMLWAKARLRFSLKDAMSSLAALMPSGSRLLVTSTKSSIPSGAAKAFSFRTKVSATTGMTPLRFRENFF